MFQGRLKILRVFVFALASLLVSACLKIKDEQGFQSAMGTDERIVGEWYAVQWLSPDPVVEISQKPDLKVEAREDNGRTVYAVISDDPKYTSDIKDFITVYKFGDSNFALTGTPIACKACLLVRYEVNGDLLSIYSIKQDEAIAYLEGAHPEKSRISYGVKGSFSDVSVEILDDAGKALLVDLVSKPWLWESVAVLKKHQP